MKISEVIMLGDEQVWARVFPAQIEYGSRSADSAWLPWVEPNEALPIDKLVTGLTVRVSGWVPTLKNPSQLASLGIKCPYFKARHSTYFAAFRARQWFGAIDEHREKKEQAKQAQQALLDLVNVIRQWVCSDRHWKFHPPISVYLDRVDPDLTARSFKTHRQVDGHLLAACGALQDIVDLLTDVFEHIPLHRNSAEVAWKAAFADELGYCWRELTGKDPTTAPSKNGISFLNFIDAAYRSLGGDPGEKWDRAARQMLYDNPPIGEANAFDRFERSRLALVRSANPGEDSLQDE
jgi:hypothetical protein